MAAYTSKRLGLPLHEDGKPFQRVDLEFRNLDHSGASYEGRIFFNRNNVDLDTPRELAAGYAGSIYVFGHAHCWGDPGHCDVPPGPLHGFDNRTAHQLVPQHHVVEVTEAIRRLAEGRSRTFTVTVLPVVREQGEPRVDQAVLDFERLTVVTYE